jgi:hypothetical protein
MIHIIIWVAFALSAFITVFLASRTLALREHTKEIQKSGTDPHLGTSESAALPEDLLLAEHFGYDAQRYTAAIAKLRDNFLHDWRSGATERLDDGLGRLFDLEPYRTVRLKLEAANDAAWKDAHKQKKEYGLKLEYKDFGYGATMSGVEFDKEYDGSPLNWCGFWEPERIYDKNDCVQFGNSTYISRHFKNEGHKPFDRGGWWNVMVTYNPKEPF